MFFPPPAALTLAHARWALSACPPEPPWLEARWRALLSAFLSAHAPAAPAGDEAGPAPLAALCLLITPRPHRAAARAALLSASPLAPQALTPQALNDAAEEARAWTLALLSAERLSPEARAALAEALTLNEAPRRDS